MTDLPTKPCRGRHYPSHTGEFVAARTKGEDDRPFLMELYPLLQERAINVLHAEHQSPASEALRDNAVCKLEDHVRTAREETAVWKPEHDHSKAELAEARAETSLLKADLKQAKVAVDQACTALQTRLEEARAETDLLKTELEQATLALNGTRSDKSG